MGDNFLRKFINCVPKIYFVQDIFPLNNKNKVYYPVRDDIPFLVASIKRFGSLIELSINLKRNKLSFIRKLWIVTLIKFQNWLLMY